MKRWSGRSVTVVVVRPALSEHHPAKCARRDHAARSSPGEGGRSSGQPRQSHPSVSTPSGRCTSVARSAGANSVTQPMPRPSARAASHRFSIAHAHDHRSASANVARPRIPAAGFACRSTRQPREEPPVCLELQIQEPASGVCVELRRLGDPLPVSQQGRSFPSLRVPHDDIIATAGCGLPTAPCGQRIGHGPRRRRPRARAEPADIASCAQHRVQGVTLLARHCPSAWVAHPRPRRRGLADQGSRARQDTDPL